MYKALLHAHSGLRYLVLFLLITLLIRSFNKWKTQQTFDKGDESLSRLNVWVMHLQWMIGLALYFISSKVWFDAATMKNALLRFFTLEHPLMMMVAVVILTIGHVKAKRSDSFLSHIV